MHRVVRFAFQKPPAVFGCWRIGQQVELPVDRADHAFFLHQSHGRRRQRVAHADQIGNRIQPLACFQPVPIRQQRLVLPQHQPLFGIVYIVREKFGRAAACRVIGGNRREFGARHPFKIDMAFAPRHEDEGTAEANLVADSNLAFDKGAVAPASQDGSTDFNRTGKRPRKGDLRAEQRRQVGSGKPGGLIGKRSAQPAIGGAALMPCGGNSDTVVALPRLELGKDIGEVHDRRLTGSAGLIKRLALAQNPASWLHGEKIRERTIYHWAKDLLPRIGALEPDTVSANFVDRIIRGAVDSGARRPRILSAIHLTDAPLRNPIGRVSGKVLVNLFTALEQEFKDASIALQLGKTAKPACFSDLGYITSFAATIGEILSSNVAIQGLRQNVWRVDLQTVGQPARLVWHLPETPSGHLDASVEFSVSTYVRMLREISPMTTASMLVRLQHRPRFTVQHYSEHLACAVEFGASQTTIEFDSSFLDRPSPNAHPALQAEILARYDCSMKWLAEGKSHSAFCYLYLASELNKSPLKLDRMAASFGLTERTLRRRLVDEGHPFRELLDQVRQDMCDLYRLENRRSMTAVAELLGYAELSAFTRAHKRWYGQPPSTFASV
jgi:AraC-like DNA-binding protein